MGMKPRRATPDYLETIVAARAHLRELPRRWTPGYAWDDSGETVPLDDMRRGDLQVTKRLAPLAQRAVGAFGIGCFEWILARLGSRVPAPERRQFGCFLQAAWAGLVSNWYMPYRESNVGGPVLGPLRVAERLLDDAILIIHDEYNAESDWYLSRADFDRDKRDLPARNVGQLEALTRYVLVEDASFIAWRDGVLDRLVAHCAQPVGDRVGPVLAPSVLDLEAPFDPDAQVAEVERYLNTLDPGANHLLPSLQNLRDLHKQHVETHWRHSRVPDIPYSLLTCSCSHCRRNA